MNKFVDFLCYTGVATLLVCGGYSVYTIAIEILKRLVAFYG